MYHNQVTNIELLGMVVAISGLFISRSGSFQILVHNRVIMKDSFNKVVSILVVRLGQGNEVKGVVGKLRVDQGENDQLNDEPCYYKQIQLEAGQCPT